MIIFSIITYKKYDIVNWPNTNARITNSICSQYNSKSDDIIVTNYKCNLDIEFLHNNNTIKTKHIIAESKVPYNIDEYIQIKYDPNNPLDVINKSDTSIVYIGSIVSFIGCILFILGLYGLIYCKNNSCEVLGGIFVTNDVITRIKR